MSIPTNPDPEATRNSDGRNPAGKSTYIKPDYRREQVFETMALACGKINTTQNTCRGARKTS